MCTNGTGCLHLDDLKSQELKTFRVLHRVFVVCSDNESKYAKLKNAFCHTCKRLGPYLHTCMHCVFFGCHKHIREHTKNKKHNFSLELGYGQVHCSRCGDYVYDAELDRIAAENTKLARRCNNKLMNWIVSSVDGEVEALRPSPKRICITAESTFGLRGLYNLGDTCFVSCIVQVLMHTPILRDYCLSERHKCKEASSRCMLCELSRLYQEFYKGERVPVSLHKLLHLILTNMEQLFLSKHAQQDAHEFYIMMMDILRQNCMDSLSPIHSIVAPGTDNDCPCIFDRIFKGQLQSDLVCEKCNGVSTKMDPFVWDFALDMGSSLTLMECLECYIRPEYLGTIMCSNCKSQQQATKQLTVKTLPLVVVFCLKRFLHYLKNDVSIRKKISTKITFPEMLDMTPFMSRTPESFNKVIPTDHRYSLFAVVNHIGTVDKGHYTAYIRQQRDYWYMCYDDIITRATLAEVLNSEGYLLFYHKHILAYE